MRHLGLTLLVVGLLAAPAGAISIGVFDNADYVDTSGGSYAESDAIQAAIASLGYSVNPFTGTTAAAWSAAMGASDALLIPELELTDSGELTTLTTAMGPTLASYVAGGGGLIVIGSQYSRGSQFMATLLNSVFGFSTTEDSLATSSTSLIQPGASGTFFAGGPSPVTNWSGTSTLGNLPAGSNVIYSSSGAATVVDIAYGSGDIVYLGWDWFNAAPLGLQDGGWSSILNSAILQKTAIPEPGTVVLMGLGLLGAGYMVRRRRRAA